MMEYTADEIIKRLGNAAAQRGADGIALSGRMSRQ